MSLKLEKELDEAMEEYPYRLNVSEIAVLREIAKSAHHEDDKAHQGGKLRTAGKKQYRARETFLVRDDMAKRIGIRPNTVGDVIRQLQQKGIRVRMNNKAAYAGNAMEYRFPTVAELVNALNALPGK